MTSTVIGWIRCRRYVPRSLKLFLYIMLRGAASVASWNVSSFRIHRTSKAGVVLTQLHYMRPQSRDMSKSHHYFLNVARIPTLVTIWAGFRFMGCHRVDNLSRSKHHCGWRGSLSIQGLTW